MPAGGRPEVPALQQLQVRNVAEIVVTQRPEGGALRQRAGGDGEVDLPAARFRQRFVEIGGERRLDSGERGSALPGEKAFLCRELGALPRPPQPFEQDD